MSLVKQGLTTFILIVVFASCGQLFNRGAQLWIFQSGRTSTGNEDTTMTAANFLFLTGDGKYTRDFGSYDYGEWKVADQKLTLTPANKSTPLVYDYRELDKSQVVIRVGSRAMNFKLLRSDGDPDENPFSYKNNTWRLHPKARESNQQIVDRLKNHCAFWKAYFTWGIKNDLQNLDVRNTPTAIKVYGNGFSLKKFHELPAQWVNCFYDSTDCQAASDKISRVFRAKLINWKWRDGKFKMFYWAFKDLGENIR